MAVCCLEGTLTHSDSVSQLALSSVGGIVGGSNAKHHESDSAAVQCLLWLALGVTRGRDARMSSTKAVPQVGTDGGAAH